MHKVFKMLLSKEKITPELVDMHKSWRPSGFNDQNRGLGTEALYSFIVVLHKNMKHNLCSENDY
ncbi:hypothetical protein PITCH_A980033 [uncultured Desulfobacterium sp.]|uniref:Uncharacterized protein n=1 Tax=uncultured Desulfobacterium sp. TaxID=201089 RepID=A0A445N493_9BACT|nr:hypothetical protein PITCH_A980033 [uncultured Desulfobacterium sp.]